MEIFVTLGEDRVRDLNYSGSTYEELLAAIWEEFEDLIPGGVSKIDYLEILKSDTYVELRPKKINTVKEGSKLRIKLKKTSAVPVQPPEAIPQPTTEEKAPVVPPPDTSNTTDGKNQADNAEVTTDKPDTMATTKTDLKAASDTSFNDDADQEEAFPMCSSAPPDLNPKPTIGHSQNPTGATGGAAAMDKLWDKDTLKVFFMGNEVNGKYDKDFMLIEKWRCRGQPMSTNTILAWARVWNYVGFKKIPYFEVTGRQGSADIRVQFTETGGNWSVVGKEAALVDNSKPTMMLNLKGHSAETMESLVVHEFGHALGLEHEHQRSDFWKVMKDYLDFDKMMKDPFVNPTGEAGGGAGWGTDWFEKAQSAKQGASSVAVVGPKKPYDPYSIMHYWFDIQWIKNPILHSYDNIDKLVKDKTDKVYLKGLHERVKRIRNKGGLTKRPSEQDYEALVTAYGGTFKSSTAKAELVASLKPEAIWQGTMHVNKHLKAFTNAVWECRVKWRDLGLQLNLTVGTLDAIEADNPKDVGGSLGAVLQTWLQKGTATVDQMIAALESDVVERQDLANNIRIMAGIPVDCK